MALTDEQLAALGLAIPPPDPTMAPPAAPPPGIMGPQPVAPQSSLGAKILPDAQIPKSKMAEAYKEGGILPRDSYEAAMPKIAPEPTAPLGTFEWQKQRGEEIASRIEQMNFKKAHPLGSPESTHPGVLGKILHGLATAGNIAGDVFAPGIMADIPGTQMHNDIVRGNLERELEQTGEAASKQSDQDVKNEKLEAETEALKHPQPKPKEEDWDVVPNFTGPNGEPILKEKNSGQLKFATGLPGVTSTKTPQKPDSPEQQFIDEYQKTHAGSTVAQAVAAYAAATQKPEKPGAGGARSDKSYTYNNDKLDKLGKPIEDATARMGRLRETLAQGSPQADALVAPELLTIMAGGAGSGLRMNEAEISRIVGGRSKWQSLEAAANQWRIDPTKANTITPEQRTQIRALVDAVNVKLQKKQQALDKAREDLLNSDDPKDHRRIVTDAHHALTQVDEGAGTTPEVKDFGPAPEGKADGATGALQDGTKVIVKGGRLVAQ